MSEDKSDVPKEVFIEGIPASPGAVTGLAYLHTQEKTVPAPKRITKEEVSLHLNCFDEAQGKIINQWKELQEKQTDETSQNIIGAQIEIIRDPELTNRIKILIQDKHFSVQKAVGEAFEEYVDLFSKSISPVIADRLIDVTDIRDQLIEATEGRISPEIEKKGDIAVAKELSPREVIGLSHQGIKGIIMERGGSTSHAAIIARSVGIPTIAGAAKATSIISNNTKVCLNGQTGFIYVNPTEDTCSQIERMSGRSALGEEEEAKLCEQPSVTADERPFTLRANVEFSEELTQLQRCRAEGIGLLRTEAVYLNRSQFGTRQNQQLFYENILEKTGRWPVTIRLFDVGGDKFLNEEIAESNPFLGWRGIRMLLDERELLREQLTAILAAAGKHPGRVKLMLPMVTLISEIDEVKKEVEHCRQVLIEEGQTIEPNVPLGIMVETPNVAVQASLFAKEVDFFSIGTNDLIQYLLAVDRGNARISHLYNQLRPVMWQMIHQTVQAALQEDIRVEVCGELASYPIAAACLLGLGVDGLSMSPASILRVKKLLITRNFDEMKALADETLRCESLDEVENLFDNWKNKK